MTRDPLLLAKDAAAVIGFVTGLVAFVKLLVSGWSSVPAVLPWAGGAYVALLAVLAVNAVLGRDPHIGRFQAAVFFVAVAGLIAVTELALFLALLGLVGASVGIIAAVGYYIEWRRNSAATVKTCPECAEEVKAAAKLCRYCGYRFESDPA